MDFSNQPEELIIQQLSQLPVEDILNACQGNKHIAQICSQPVLWRKKLQMDFPGVDVRIPNPKERYLELIDERAKQELQRSLVNIPWTIGKGVQYNLERIPEAIEFYAPQIALEIINRLQQSISGLHRLVIYYPMEYWTENLQRVEYATNKAISPQQVLESIEQFYDQPYQGSIKAIIDIRKKVTGISRIPQPSSSRSRIADNLLNRVNFEELRPYKEGFTLNLGYL